MRCKLALFSIHAQLGPDVCGIMSFWSYNLKSAIVLRISSFNHHLSYVRRLAFGFRMTIYNGLCGVCLWCACGVAQCIGTYTFYDSSFKTYYYVFDIRLLFSKFVSGEHLTLSFIFIYTTKPFY